MNYSRRNFLKAAGISAAAVLSGCAGRLTGPAAQKSRPNILMILTDDQGWGDLSVNGNVNLKTPNIDSLAGEGVVVENFYVCPVCSPTRAEMLTGRYYTRVGVTGTSEGGERINADESTIGDTFKAAGYATAAFGKWHSGTQWPYHPNARGFDEFYGFCSGHWGYYFSPQLEHNGRLVKGNGYIADDFTDHALDFIEKNKNTPFFCYVPYNIPHSPMQVPESYWEKFDGKELEMRHRDPEKENIEHTRAALAMCENIDWNVGRLLEKLDKLGIADNTIVIYFSDNGPNGWRWNAGMKGRKGTTDEGGVRSPFFIRWPAEIRQGTEIPHIAAAIDLLPTLAELAEIPIVGNKKLDGVSLKPLLLGTSSNWQDRMYFSTWNGRVSVRTQKYRLDHEGRLFDMDADPGQRKDVSQKHPEITARLKKAVREWKDETFKPVEPRPFTVGHPGAEITLLPARDGKANGNIERSSIHPNCSFFTNWIDENDSITWDIEVLTAGLYEAQIHYTCKRENVGAELELSFDGERVSRAVKNAYESELKGKEENHVYMRESFVKDFKPMSLGTLRMHGKRGTLRLRAANIPGNEAVDLRYLTLKYKGK
ncbi:Arylsulfatase [Limihaloglobus sulfuriphilus]|uniref:Arylsulfatase n=1 Tax=Limihaloglobus sulfuriphilus TaxID=1851148 RepID=A0A1Q2MHI2_9BACT|nr:sulfatase-like hydrolase/transferase [Limihaloglobus sulfuriphilus]AQQ71988.1 Arylsulfatase [Limihaloglobus sulfuriphilus]